MYIANGGTLDEVIIYGDFSEGRLGMGTTSPVAKIHVETTGDTALYGHRSDGTYGYIAGDWHALYGWCSYPGGYGIWVHGDGYAGWFDGDVNINGNLTGGRGGTSIDHPLDPENKILNHSYVESNENLLIYRGKVHLNANGEAVVSMPDYFTALANETEASIHLIPVGRPFLAGAEWNNGYLSLTVYGEANREVFWEVLAERNDPVVRQMAMPVEQDKGPDALANRGELLYPTAYGYPESRGVNHSKLNHDKWISINNKLLLTRS